jgi:hypothetical protein
VYTDGWVLFLFAADDNGESTLRRSSTLVNSVVLPCNAGSVARERRLTAAFPCYRDKGEAMNHLKDICSGRGDFKAMTLGRLRENCQDLGQAFGLSTVEIVLLILVVLVGLFWLLAARQRANADAGTVVGNTIEGALYAAIGFFAGSGFGLFVAEVVPPDLLGTIFWLVGLVALAFAIIGAAKGDGDTGGKAVAVVLGVLLAGLCVMIAVFAYAVPNSGAAGDDYETYLNVVAISLGLLGALDGIIAALLRGPHWAAGWALVFLNSSWGFLGNILGLGTHLGSYLCWANDGDPERDNRKAYTLYRRGLTLRQEAGNRYAFTQGWVMCCDRSGPLEVHEAIHVGQHFVLGPIYVVSHGIWDLLGAGIGLIAVPIKHLQPDEAITNMGYFNNPYEIMAYATHNGARQSTKPLIIASPWSFIFMALWILGAIALTIGLVVSWT